MKSVIILTATIGLLMASSCVPLKRFNELEGRYQRSETNNERLRLENELARTQNELLTTRIKALEDDTTHLGNQIRRLQLNYEQLQTTYAQVTEYNRNLLEGKEEETRQILSRLQTIQEDLQQREDELIAAEKSMVEKQRNLDSLINEMVQKEQRLNELEAILNRQDSVVNALRNTVSNALLGFEGRGLSIELKNGKVYVSLDESLLFATGSTVVDPRGETALRELARVLEQNSDINVMIEGHTDDVPLRGGGTMKDNWDLSVLRATSVLRILLKHGSIDPQRLTVAGRGEYMPLDPEKTAEARQKNRRTEIILTPRLDDLFRIIEQN
jgi:chemotaxis protein MotB